MRFFIGMTLSTALCNRIHSMGLNSSTNIFTLKPGMKIRKTYNNVIIVDIGCSLGSQDPRSQKLFELAEKVGSNIDFI